MASTEFDQRGAARIVDVPGRENASDGCDIGAVEFGSINVAVEEEPEEIPQKLLISPAYPNPFFSKTTFNLVVPTTQDITISLFNILGKEVQVIHSGQLKGRRLMCLKLTGLHCLQVCIFTGFWVTL